MKTGMLRRLLSLSSLAIAAMLLTGCCAFCDKPECGTGTIEGLDQAGKRVCKPTLKCGRGTVEEENEAGERVCLPALEPELSCGTGSQEQATGGERECTPSPALLECGEGTHLRIAGQQEGASGGERECVPSGATAPCEEGELEGASGGEREGQTEGATGGERECYPVPLRCGPGTLEVLSNGQKRCQPISVKCGAGTREVSGKCVVDSGI